MNVYKTVIQFSELRRIRADKRAFILILFVTAIFLAGCDGSRANSGNCDDLPLSQDGTIEGELGKKLDEYIDSGLEFDFSGQVLVEYNGNIILQKGYGLADRKQCIAVTNETTFWIGSLSKQFTASAILKLQEQGMLNTSDSITAYINDVPIEKQNITIHHLLTHSSGLSQQYAADGISNRTKAVKRILREPLKHNPGEGYTYSGDGYNLLAIIVELASGKTFEEYLHEHFFKLADMTRSGFSGDKARWSELRIAKRAPGTSRKGSPQFWDEDWGFRGATGILTTVEDLHKWHLTLQGDKVLSDTSKAQLFKRHVLKRETIYYGYGWNIAQSKHGTLIVHSGDDDFNGHSSSYRWYVDRGLLVIVTSNAGYHKDRSVSPVLASQLSRLLFSP